MFEAIPDIVTIDEIPNDKRLTLTMKEKIAILTRQTEELMEENARLRNFVAHLFGTIEQETAPACDIHSGATL